MGFICKHEDLTAALYSMEESLSETGHLYTLDSRKNKQRLVITNKDILEQFFAKNPTVPHNKKYLFKLCNQIREK